MTTDPDAAQGISDDAFQGVPDIKVKQFAAEARSLDVASMNDLMPPKRLTLTAALALSQTARALADVADMFVRRMQRIHNHAYDALLKYQAELVERTDHLVATLHGVTLAYWSEDRPTNGYPQSEHCLNPKRTAWHSVVSYGSMRAGAALA